MLRRVDRRRWCRRVRDDGANARRCRAEVHADVRRALRDGRLPRLPRGSRRGSSTCDARAALPRLLAGDLPAVRAEHLFGPGAPSGALTSCVDSQDMCIVSLRPPRHLATFRGSRVPSKICEGAGTSHSTSDNGYRFLMHAIWTLPRVARSCLPDNRPPARGLATPAPPERGGRKHTKSMLTRTTMRPAQRAS